MFVRLLVSNQIATTQITLPRLQQSSSSPSCKFAAMIPIEMRGTSHLLTSDNPFLIPENINNFLPNITNDLLGTNHHNHHHRHLLLLHSDLNNGVQASSSTSDEAEEKQTVTIDERKQRRMISNRESARRSRMRKQRHMVELWSQVVRLRTENHNLIHRLNHVAESHDRVVQENAKLREEASDLRQMIADLQIGFPFANTLTVFDDFSDF